MSERVPTLTPSSWPFFSSSWLSDPRLCGTWSPCLLVLCLLGAAACSSQLKPRGEIYSWDARMSHGPEGGEHSWPGSRNQAVCPSSQGFWGPSHLPPYTSFWPQRAQQEKGCPSPVLKNSSVSMPSIPAPMNNFICTLITDSLKRSRLAPLGQVPTLVHAVRKQGWGGVGMAHLIDGSRKITKRVWGQVGHLHTCHISWRRKSPLSPSVAGSARCMQTEAVRLSGFAGIGNLPHCSP